MAKQTEQSNIDQMLQMFMHMRQDDRERDEKERTEKNK